MTDSPNDQKIPMQLELYVRHGCHLCTQMREALYPYEQSGQVSLRVIDIDSNRDLVHRYGLLVPVLSAGEEVLFEYFLDPTQLERRLASAVDDP